VKNLILNKVIDVINITEQLGEALLEDYISSMNIFEIFITVIIKLNRFNGSNLI